MTNISCTRKADEAVKNEAAGQHVTAANVGKNEKKDETDKDIKEKYNFSIISETEGKDFLLYMENVLEPVYPQDFKIGQLQPASSGDEVVDKIYGTADRFLLSIINKELAVALISTGKREFVERNLIDQINDFDLIDYRIGLINIQVEPATVDIRLQAGNVFFGGTLYFIREGDWKVYDFQSDFTKSDESKKNANEKWFPLYNIKM